MPLSLVIPCFNEAASIPALLVRCSELLETLRALEEDAEVILVDNGSRDATPTILAERLPAYPGVSAVTVTENTGYGAGILAGLRATRGDIIGWTHADLQTDPRDAAAGFARFRDTPQPERLFVKGRRRGRPVSDTFFTVGMAAFETALLRAPLWDINAQPTLFHRSFFEGWAEPPGDFSLDLYAYHRAVTEGLQICRVDVRFERRLHGQSHWNVDLRSKLRFIRRTVDYSLALRRGR